MKFPGDRKDTLINKYSTVYFIVCKYNKLSWRSQGHKCSASLYVIHRVDIYMSLRSPGHFIPWRTLIFLSIFRSTILRF